MHKASLQVGHTPRFTEPAMESMHNVDYLMTCRMSSGKPAAVATISGSMGLRIRCRCLPSYRPLAALPRSLPFLLSALASSIVMFNHVK